MPRWIAIIVKIIVYVFVTAMTLFILYGCIATISRVGAGIILAALVSLGGFYCFARSAWNNYSTIRNLKNQLKVRGIDMRSLGKSGEGSIIIKVIGYVWATAVTLLLSCAAWGGAPHISPHSSDYFLLPFILLGGPMVFCCFVWLALDDYLTIRGLKEHLDVYEENQKER